MITCSAIWFMCCSRLFDPWWTARWALLLRAGQSLLEPRLVTVTGGLQTESEPHQNSRWAAAWRAARRSPEPSLARHRSYGNRLVAAFTAHADERSCHFGSPRLTQSLYRGCRVAATVPRQRRLPGH